MNEERFVSLAKPDKNTSLQILYTCNEFFVLVYVTNEERFVSRAKPDKNTPLQILYTCSIYFNTCLQNAIYLLKL